MPTLKTVIERYASRAFLNIELKVTGLAEYVSQLLADHSMKGYLVSSFVPEAIMEIAALVPSAHLGLICDSESQLRQRQSLPIGNLAVKHRLLDAHLFDALRNENLEIFVWTVNDPAEMLKLARMGVDAIISDETELLVRTLAT